MSLRFRLTLTYSVLVALILSVFAVILYVTMQQNLEAEMDRRLLLRAGQVQLIIWPGTDSLTPSDLSAARLDLSPLAELDAPGLYVQIVNRAGEVIASSENLQGSLLPSDPTSFQSALAGQQRYSDVRLGAGRVVRMLSVPILFEDRVLGVLEVGQSRSTLQQTMADLRRTLILLGTAAIIGAAAVGWLVAYQGLRPLRAMSDQAAAIAARRAFGRRLVVSEQKDEVGRLARTINELLATVEETLRHHREFVADTSHELRNPLLAIQTNIELLDRVQSEQDRAECIQEAGREVDRMTRPVSDLLLLAQVEAGQVIERRPVDLAVVLDTVIRRASPRAGYRDLRLEAEAGTVVPGDEGRLTQVFSNLIDNALRHTPPNGTIAVRLSEESEWVRVEVADSGEGISAENLPHIFDRFYRIDKARSRNGAGTGLGLAIVKHLVEAHGGTVSVESRLGHGTCFLVRLPRRPAAAPTVGPSDDPEAGRRAAPLPAQVSGQR